MVSDAYFGGTWVSPECPLTAQNFCVWRRWEITNDKQDMKQHINLTKKNAFVMSTLPALPGLENSLVKYLLQQNSEPVPRTYETSHLESSEFFAFLLTHKIQAIGKKGFSCYVLHQEIKVLSRHLCNTRARKTLCKLWRKSSVTAQNFPSERGGDAKPQKLHLWVSLGNTSPSDPLKTCCHWLQAWFPQQKEGWMQHLCLHRNICARLPLNAHRNTPQRKSLIANTA